MSIKKLVIAGLIIGMLLGLAVTYPYSLDANDLRTIFNKNKIKTKAFVNIGELFEGRHIKLSFEDCTWTTNHSNPKRVQYVLLTKDNIQIENKNVLWNIRIDFQKTEKPKDEDDNIKSMTIRIPKEARLDVDENPLDYRNIIGVSLEGLTDHCIVEME